MLGIIKRNFRDIKQDAFIRLYKSLVRSHPEYANSVWSPYHVQDIEALEKSSEEGHKINQFFKTQFIRGKTENYVSSYT